MKRLINRLSKRAFHYSQYDGNWRNVNQNHPSYLYKNGWDIVQQFQEDFECPEEKGKTRVVVVDPDEPLVCGDNVPDWSFDGSSTGQASGGNSDVKIVPMALYPDPFRGGRHMLAMCECVDQGGKPLKSNHRAHCRQVMEKVAEHDMIFAFEQEYVLLQNNVPVGWSEDGEFPEDPQGPYYCGAGNENIQGRNFVEAHALACLATGLHFEGINAEVMLGQWEYQVGPIGGTEIGDELEISRYLMYRIGEMMNLCVNIHPKPVFEGGWNGTGNHCNCSSKEMREEGGLKYILDAVTKLEANHKKHMEPECYGKENEKRLSGRFETQHIDKFSCGVADRGSSIRIQRQVFEKGYGWFEDRRPAANISPYVVCSRIAKTLFGLDDLKLEMEMEGIPYDY